MNNKTHKIGGVCAGVVTSTLLFSNNIGFETALSSALIISGATIGSLAPDIDKPNSKMGKKLLLKPISIFINKVFGHRTITHSVLMSIFMTLCLLSTTVLFTSILNFIYSNLIIGFCVGWFSHLLLDSITVQGIPVFYPITKKKYNLLSFKTGDDEDLVSILVIAITGIYMIAYFYL